MIFAHNLGNHIPCPWLNWCFKHTASLNFTFILYLKGKLLTGISWKTGISCKMYLKKKQKWNKKQNKTKNKQNKKTKNKTKTKTKQQNKKQEQLLWQGSKWVKIFKGHFGPWTGKKWGPLFFDCPYLPFWVLCIFHMYCRDWNKTQFSRALGFKLLGGLTNFGGQLTLEPALFQPMHCDEIL